MTNNRKINPATTGTNDSTAMEMVATYPVDTNGDDITSSNPLPVQVPGFKIPDYDYIAATYPTTTTEVYTYKSGGSGGTTVATITLTFSDASKEQLTSVEKT
jgi:hypothetical protein